MSRAFTKEQDDAPVREPEAPEPPPEVTAAGLAELRARLVLTTDPAERARLERRIEDAVIVAPPTKRDEVAFGAIVRVSGGPVQAQTYTIVGELESDAKAGRISVSSPLAQAMLGHRVRDRVIWHRPIGDLRLTIDAIAYPQSGVVS